MHLASRLAVVILVLATASSSRAQDQGWANAALVDWQEVQLEAGWVKAFQDARKPDAAKAYVLAGLFQFGRLMSLNQGHMPNVRKALEEFNAAAELAYKDHPPGEDDAKGAAALKAHKARLLELAAVMELPPLGKFPAQEGLKSKAARVLAAAERQAEAAKEMMAYAAEAPNARWHLKNAKDTNDLLMAMRLLGSGVMAVDVHKAEVGALVLAAAQRAVDEGQSALKKDDLDLATWQAADLAEWTSLAGAFGDAAPFKAAAAELTKGIEKRYEERVAENRLPTGGYQGDAAAMEKAVGDLYKKAAPKDKLLKVILVSPSFLDEWRARWSTGGDKLTVSRSMILERAAVVVDGKDGKVSVRTIQPFKNWSGGAWGPLQLDVRGAYQMLKKNMK